MVCITSSWIRQRDVFGCDGTRQTVCPEVLVRREGGRFRIIRKLSPPKTEHSKFENSLGKNLCYFVIVNGSEEFTVCVSPESRHSIFHFNENKAKLCKVVELEELKLPRLSVFS